MKIKYTVVVLSMLLSGCYQVALHGDIQAGTEFCSSRGGINNITIRFEGSELVTCQNGDYASVHEIIQGRSKSR